MQNIILLIALHLTIQQQYLISFSVARMVLVTYNK